MTPLVLGLKVLLAYGLLREVSGHAHLISPVPRGGAITDQTATYPGGNNIKLTPFTNAPGIVNDNTDGCGGTQNGVQSVAGTPTATYEPGAQIAVGWSVTIPHDADLVTTGVRVALKYSATDGYQQNILAGGVTGDPGVGTVSSGSTAIETTVVTLPTGKECNPCTLQWVQAAQQDGGYYLNCADIIISSTPTGANTATGGTTATGGATATGATTGTGGQPIYYTSGTSGTSGGGGYGVVSGSHPSHCSKVGLVIFVTGFAIMLLHQ
jgi:hypothetical protein|mmetsp:Transcript_15742/g.25607  ORF Transcript_15742/g.25607 Transcript_15742/m.25607 type:complete len:267 (-) Transcript_15742:176-976(-)|eukprot:CAMPEP_0169070008 /NCGR_PEP_ID=MMETSP1015-20121227/4880_1 /TAXON_ID=342587 /ORGANISM="Karlodinium micrum, Strain CCMP2283" /LENGTH=266 /DNA_ID=CAMNT_0009128965 /DNA_START=36 /DNA_END=836 /DNA_ORIENTATION=+